MNKKINLLISIMLFTLAISCGASAQLIVTSPTASTSTSPVLFQADASAYTGTKQMVVTLDGVTIFQQHVVRFSFTRAVAAGSHHAVIKSQYRSGGWATKNVYFTIAAAPPPPVAPTAQLNASPGQIVVGDSAMLSWTTTNATSVTIDNGIGGVITSGSRSVSPTVTTTYTLTANGTGGTAISTVQVVVVQPLQITTTFLPDGQCVSDGVGGWNPAPYSYQLQASGGTPPYSFSLSSGSLPPGLFLNASGLVSGNIDCMAIFGMSTVNNYISRPVTTQVAYKVQ